MPQNQPSSLLHAFSVAASPLSIKSLPNRLDLFNTMKTILSVLFAGLLAGTASAVELTPDKWDEMTAGKTVFIKFLAPW